MKPRCVLRFRVGSEEYGIDVMKVQEVRYWEPPAPIPDTPAYVKGAIELRGTMVPIIDLRLLFNLGEARYESSTLVIILRLGGGLAGAVVDAASGVITLGPRQAAAVT